MYVIDNQSAAQSYTDLMDGIKSLNYEINFLQKRVKVLKNPKNSITECIKRHVGGREEDFKNPIIKGASNYFSEERIAIYTCITGNYDQVYEPMFVPDNCDFFVITDQEIPKESYWKKIDTGSYVEQYLNEKQKTNPITVSRFFKMFPFEVFKDYRYSIYIDANFEIYTDLTEYVHKINSQYGLGFFQHEDRDCVYDEARRCVELGKDSSENLAKCVEYLRKQGMPYNYGLLAGGFIVRDHSNTRVISLMQAWWDAYNQLSCRDQISLPFILYKNNIRPVEVGTMGKSYKEELSFRRVPHKKQVLC